MEEFDFMERLRLKIKDEVRNRFSNRPQFVFHGTNNAGKTGIESEGFRPSQTSWYGPGVYTSHSLNVADDFASNTANRLHGVLPEGFRYKTMPENMTTDEFLKRIGAPLPPHMSPAKEGRNRFYDVRSSAASTFPRMDGIRIPGREDQLLIFDEKLANEAFRAGGQRGEVARDRRARELRQARTPANTSRAMSMLIDGNRNGLSNTFSKAETGNVLADLVTQLSEALFGPIDPKKKKTDQLKIR